MIMRLLVNAIVFYVVAYLVPGVEIVDWQALIVVSVVWGVLAAILRPILVALTLPINIVSLGLFYFVINAALLLLMSEIVPGFLVSGFLNALVAALVMGLLNVVLSGIE